MALLAEAEPTFGDQVIYWFQRGAILERFHRRPEAKAAFRKALEVEPAHAPTLNYLGYMLVEDGGPMDEAVSLIEKALTEDPDNGSYLDSLGWAYFKQGTDGRGAQAPGAGRGPVEVQLGDPGSPRRRAARAEGRQRRDRRLGARAGGGRRVHRRGGDQVEDCACAWTLGPPVIRRALVASSAAVLLATAACAPKVSLALAGWRGHAAGRSSPPPSRRRVPPAAGTRRSLRTCGCRDASTASACAAPCRSA